MDVKGPGGKLLTFKTAGYRTFTPGPASQGRYTFDVVGPEDGGAVAYRLTVAPAAPDDVGAGLALTQATPARGSISPATADVVDVYHFVVAGDRSNIRVTLETRPKSGVSMTLDRAVRREGRHGTADGRAPPSRRPLPRDGRGHARQEGGGLHARVRGAPEDDRHDQRAARASCPRTSGPRSASRSPRRPRPATSSCASSATTRRTAGCSRRRVLVPVPGGLVPWRPTEPGRWRVSAHYPGALAFSASSTKVHEFTLVRARELPPGKPLARSGVPGRVDWKSDVNDVYWTQVEAGTTYLVAFTSGCARVTMTMPGGETAKLSCNGFRAFTPGPGETGRVVLDVTAPEDRGRPRTARRRACGGRTTSVSARRSGTSRSCAARSTRQRRTSSTSTGSRSPTSGRTSGCGSPPRRAAGSR